MSRSRLRVVQTRWMYSRCRMEAIWHGTGRGDLAKLHLQVPYAAAMVGIDLRLIAWQSHAVPSSDFNRDDPQAGDS